MVVAWWSHEHDSYLAGARYDCVLRRQSDETVLILGDREEERAERIPCRLDEITLCRRRQLDSRGDCDRPDEMGLRRVDAHGWVLLVLDTTPRAQLSKLGA